MTDDAHRQLIKHAARLAMTDRGELAQLLRDAIDGAQRYSFLRGDVPPSSNRWQRWRVEYFAGVNGWVPLAGSELDGAITASNCWQRP